MAVLENRRAPIARPFLLGQANDPASLLHVAVGQDQWYHFRVGAPPILIYSGGDWDVHWGYDLDFDPRPCWQWLGVIQ